MVATGKVDFSGFLAAHAPAGRRYPVAAGFVLLGVTMYGTALWIARTAVRRSHAR